MQNKTLLMSAGLLAVVLSVLGIISIKLDNSEFVNDYRPVSKD